jgi:hypothetical protein
MTKPFVVELNNKTFDLDVTGWLFNMAFHAERRPIPPVTPLFELSGSITQAVATSASDPSTVQFDPSSANMDQEPGTYYFDVEATDATPDTDIVLKGELVILQGINP